MTVAAPRVVERPRLATLAIYGTGIGLSAFLLFSVEPLVGRLVLPVFGGVPAAWATVLAFFQGVLLLGYLYGHVSVTRLGVRRGAVVHVGVAVAAFALLLAAPQRLGDAARRVDPAGAEPARDPGDHDRARRVPADRHHAAPVRVVCRRARRRDARRRRPVLALRAEQRRVARCPPGLPASSCEPALGLTAPARDLERGDRPLPGDRRGGGRACLGASCGLQASPPASFSQARIPRPVPAAPPRERIDNRRRLRWFVLAAIPTGLLTAVTTFIATDLVSAPLLWVGPLAIYLASFVVAFSGRGGRLVRWATIGAPAAATLLWVPLGSAGIWPLVPLVATELAGYAVVATALHGRLAADRPAVSHLTEFYLVLALAGVVAGGFVALVAPAIFPDVWEYPLLVGSAVAAFAVTLPSASSARSRRAVPRLPTAHLDFSPFVAASGVASGHTWSWRVLLASGPRRPGIARGRGRDPLAPRRRAGPPARRACPASSRSSTAVVLVLAVAGAAAGAALPRPELLRRHDRPAVARREARWRSSTGRRCTGSSTSTRRAATRPATYYVEDGPIGDVFRRPARAQPAHRRPAAPSGSWTGRRRRSRRTVDGRRAAGPTSRSTPWSCGWRGSGVLHLPARRVGAARQVVVGDGRLELERSGRRDPRPARARRVQLGRDPGRTS